MSRERSLLFIAKGVGGLILLVLIVTFIPIWVPLLVGKWFWEDVLDVH